MRVGHQRCAAPVRPKPPWGKVAMVANGVGANVTFDLEACRTDRPLYHCRLSSTQTLTHLPIRADSLRTISAASFQISPAFALAVGALPLYLPSALAAAMPSRCLSSIISRSK